MSLSDRMTKEFLTMRTPLLASLACLALCACASDDVGPTLANPVALTPSEHFAIEVKPSSQELMLAAHASGLSPAQSDALGDFMSRWMEANRGEITVKAPEHGPDSAGVYRTATAARDFLISEGVPADAVKIVGYDAGGDAAAPVRVSFVRYEAKGPQCGQSWADLAQTHQNVEYPEFGCSVTANIAAQLDDPADLLHPRASDPPDAQRRGVVLDKYRTGVLTSTPRDPQADVTLSDVGGN
ncbi:MAG TPA: CpaD family pilus assembly protein [Caulobacteraceae bacterium]|jgi:pilus assembly protein CpaD